MMRSLVCALMVAALWTQAGCSRARKPAAPPAKTAEARARDLVRINQFYSTVATLHPGEKELLCYGVENARAVWLSPPRRQVSAAYSRCVEATPAATTTYTLTAEGLDGVTAIRRLRVAVGAAPPAGPRARIVDVTVSALSVSAGKPVSICYTVENSTEVRIEPIHFNGGAYSKSCAVDQPRQTTTYVVTAKGASGQDVERVTVAVQ
ncbi:MAG: hypothetical protein ABSF25_12950 [Bryobacteraceae bacterium]|jgi:hypothetical protein